MDEAQSSPARARAKERESQPTASEGDPERMEQPAPAADAAARGPMIDVAPDSDESAVTSGSPEAAALHEAAASVPEPVQPDPSDLPDTADRPLPAAPAQEMELDVEEADRYAASIRPSWADPEPPRPSMPPRQAIGASDGVARVIRHNTRIDLNPPLRKRRGGAYAILSASLLGVAGLLYLGVSSSTIDHAEERGRSGSETAQRQAPAESETSVQAAQNPTVPAEPEQRGPRLSDPEPGERADGIEQLQAASGESTVLEGTQVAATDEAAPNAVQPTGAEPAAEEQPLAAAPAADAPQGTASQTDSAEQAENAAAPPPAVAAPQASPAAETGATSQPTALTAQLGAAPQASPAAPAPAAPAPRGAQPNAKLAANPVPELKALQPSAAPAPQADGVATDDKVVLSLAAYPPSTRLRVDGQLVENPYKARVPKSSKHRIDAAAPGFAPETHIMRMEADVQLMISLKREPPRDVKADPYRDVGRRPAAVAAPSRDRGAGFVVENPY